MIFLMMGHQLQLQLKRQLQQLNRKRQSLLSLFSFSTLRFTTKRKTQTNLLKRCWHSKQTGWSGITNLRKSPWLEKYSNSNSDVLLKTPKFLLMISLRKYSNGNKFNQPIWSACKNCDSKASNNSILLNQHINERYY